MKSVKDYIKDINASFDAISYPDQPRGLYDPIEYTIRCGGKRLRPMLLLATADALGLKTEHAMNQAIGIEMFHNFTLLHDDVMDRADMRRGNPTVHVKWNEATAILSGDAMLTMASQLMGDCPDGKLRDVLSMFNKTAMEIYEGQQYDMDFETRDDVTEAEYIYMIRLKTSVLLGCACAIGAMLAQASPAVVGAFYNYGISLGLAFQLQDDLLDTYGDPGVFGKKTGGDILNDKKTFLLITALEKADASQRAEIESLYGQRSDDKISRIKAIYDNLKVADVCRKRIAAYIADAVGCLDTIKLSDEARAFFVNLAESSSDRKS